MDNKILLCLLAVFLPPIAVYLKKGVGNDIIINVVLCVLFYLPGSIHALWLVLKK